MSSVSFKELFKVDDTYNRISMHNMNFVATQTFRLVMMIATFAFWICLLYVWVKAVFG